MVRGPLRWWDDYWTLPWWRETEPHIKGTTAVQFIRTSNITIHALDLQRAVRVNVFSCKPFDPVVVRELTTQWFRGDVVNELFIDRL
jgi:S-adenosylmethionine/arginine decarboxylase-like enzyme